MTLHKCDGCRYLNYSTPDMNAKCDKLGVEIYVHLTLSTERTCFTPKECPYISSLEEIIIFILKNEGPLNQSKLVDKVKEYNENIKISDIVPTIWALIDDSILELRDDWKIGYKENA